jgi:2-amino-4-hydroxy-6-hydroxymethyldihydropteridine diphosphokinase
MNTAHLLLGSNINPVENTCRAVGLLRSKLVVVAASRTWETKSIGSPGPNYINLAIKGFTDLDCQTLKEKILLAIEHDLGRVRSEDKNAPRTIDIDILVFNGEVMEPRLWDRPYEALPLSDLLPDLLHPTRFVKLREVAQELQQVSGASVRPELLFY